MLGQRTEKSRHKRSGERTGVVLASASPRRVHLLRDSGYRVEVCPPGIEELLPGHFTVAESTLWNAKRKAESVAGRFPGRVVVAADTLVAHGGKVLGKPRSLRDAGAMLRRLAGDCHDVFSGVWVFRRDVGGIGLIERSVVRFRALAEADIGRYLRTIDPMDKAGAYAAQEDPFGIIAGIEGSRSNVIGLPMERLGALLAGKFGVFPS